MIVAKPDKISGPIRVKIDESLNLEDPKWVHKAFGGLPPPFQIQVHEVNPETFQMKIPIQNIDKKAAHIVYTKAFQTITILGWLPGGLFSRALVTQRKHRLVVKQNLRAPETLVDFLRPKGEPLLWTAMAPDLPWALT